MPLQRPANYGFSEAVSQLYRYHGWPIHDTSTAAASTNSSRSGDRDGAGAGVGDGGEGTSSSVSHKRRPSMRPLDYRWDRSRGIVSSSYNQRRTYASRPIQRSTSASTPAAGPSKGFGPSSAARAVDSGWKGGLYGSSSGYSLKQGKDLEKTNRDLTDEVNGLQARIKEQKLRAESLENDMAVLKSRIVELDKKHESAVEKARRDLHAQEDKHRLELETLGPRIAENKDYLDGFRRELQAPLFEQINRLNEAQLRDQRDLQNLKTAMEDQGKWHETMQRNAIAHSRDLRIALDKATKELQGIRSRKQEDRADYTRYQSIFSDLNDGIFQARDEIHHTRRRIDEERILWQKSIQRFKTSDHLRLFLHSSKYAGTKKAIEEYMAEQIVHAKTTNDGLRQLELKLVQDRHDMQSIAHDSRALTRHHQLDEHQSAYNSAHLAQRLATMVPFQQLRNAYTEEIEHLRKLIDEASPMRETGDDSKRIKVQMQELMDARGKVRRFLTFFVYVQDLRALEALQDDDIVEKAVWVDTIKAKQALDAAVERFYGKIEDQPYQSTEDWNRRHLHREDVRVQRREFDYLVAQVRQRHLLAYDLGKVTESEQIRVEQTIKRQTELAKSAVDGSLAGLGFQKPSVQQRVSIHKGGEDITTATTDTTSKPAPTSNTLKASLSIKLARKKQRTALAEKKPVVLKRSPWKAKVDRKKKLSAGLKKVSIKSSTEDSKLVPGNTMGDDAEDKKNVNSTGVSGLKPTDSRQAQWRQPAYETGFGDSKAGIRASPGDSIGFSTLKAALARSNEESEESIARPIHGDNSTIPTTAVADDTGLPTPEDSTSAFDGGSSEAASEADEAVPEEPQTVLSYQIPPKDYRDAVMASPNSNAAYWSHTLYKNAESQKPVVYYCQSYDATEARAKLFLDEPVLGFDMEWEARATMKADKPDIKRNVSLIQIAAEDKIGLFQLARFRTAKTAEEHMPPSLRKILESADIVKAGVNISGDSTRLKKCIGVEMKGIFELSHMFRVVHQSKKFPVTFRQVSLMQQVQEVLHLPLKKDDVRISAWSKELNTQQTSYAASDAYAGFQLFHRLDNKRKAMIPKPPRPAFYESWQPLILGDGTMVLRSSGTNGNKRAGVKKGNEFVQEEDEDEEDEFFDAPETIDTYNLGSEPQISGSIPMPEDSHLVEQTTEFGSPSTRQKISYPTLPLLDHIPGEAAGPAATTSASSRTIALPLRAKLTSKDPPQHAAPPTSPEEEEIYSKRSAAQIRPGPLPCPEVQAAETWIITHRAKHSGVGTPTLRAYHLWHHQKFELREVAGFCRDPPLAITTVASYIMQALNEAELPFDGERARGVLGVLPGSVHGKYRGFLEKGEMSA